MSRVVVIGASTKEERYSNQAVKLLKENGHTVFAIGNKAGIIDDTEILVGKPTIKNLDTITLYINPDIQKEYYDYIVKLRPRRLIFNPGTENIELFKLASENKIITEEACTLVLLRTGQF